MTTVRTVTLDLLRRLGMRRIFGNPGSTELTFFRDFPGDFAYVLGLQESVAVGMADGYAQATHNAALVNLHSAVGVGHAMGNIFTAFRNRTPLVITAGQQSRSLLPLEPFLFSAQATELPRPYVKWAVEPARAADVPRAIERAYHVAMTPPRGPVFVSVPIDDWDAPCEPLPPRAVAPVQRADAAALGGLADALARSRRPVFIVGAAVDRDGAWDDLVQLAERHGALVWASPLIGRCGFPEDHRLFAGFLPAFREQIHQRLAGHDLLLALGAQLFTYHAEGTGPYVPDGLAVYQVSEDPDWAASAVAGQSIVGSVGAAVKELLAVPREAPPAAQAGRKPAPRLPLSDPLTDSLLLQTLAELRTPDSIVVEEAPSSREPMHDYLPILKASTFYTCSSGGLGHALPAAVGIAIARPGQRVIALLGDGSAMYSIQALWNAAQLKLPLTVIIVNNGGYAALKFFSQRFGIAAPVGTELPGIDFVQLARGLGCEGRRVTRAADLHAALREALAATAPTLVEVQVG
ncbi:MAG TPA: benzoylformate decarboxylase [Steroidobacteraceae bacterium]|nr:benzoylformate decarboxylase [Steroidobacteraceae bacterium]